MFGSTSETRISPFQDLRLHRTTREREWNSWYLFYCCHNDRWSLVFFLIRAFIPLNITDD